MMYHELVKLTTDLVSLQTVLLREPVQAALRLDSVVDDCTNTLRRLEKQYSFQPPKNRLRRLTWTKKPLWGSEMQLKRDIEELRAYRLQLESFLLSWSRYV